MIWEALQYFRLYVTCDKSLFPSDFHPTTLKTLRMEEWSQYEIPVPPRHVLCTYTRRYSREIMPLDVRLLGPRQPQAGTMAIVVKDAGSVRARDPANQRWSVEVDGSTLLGHEFSYKKRDPRTREIGGMLRRRARMRKEMTSMGVVPDYLQTEYVASLQYIQDIGDVYTGAFVRVPIDCVCRFEC